MKTSLMIDDKVFQDAKNEAALTGKTVSEIISIWARMGREERIKQSLVKGKEFCAVNLGKPLLDLSNRKNWMEELENGRD